MKGILSCKHLRLKCRVILERLVRKFDHEMVASFVPKKHQKLMMHIRKMNERHLRKKRSSMQQRKEGGKDEGVVPGSKHRAKPTPRFVTVPPLTHILLLSPGPYNKAYFQSF